ncbi:MAG: squalene/phytoene synthase family protein [Emcibacter sp.]|nr:squalene/phytoene synthase family protein [Emcibacter sp.]
MTYSLENTAHCRTLVAQFDHDRYLTTLYARQEKREGLYAIYAFNYEISRIRETVSEPMLGEIRLQWWREAIEGIYQDNIQNHDVVLPLATAINEFKLPRDIFMAIIDGRSQDLYDDSPENIAALEDYLHKTAGNIACLAVLILGQKDSKEPTSELASDLPRRLGVAWGYVGIIRAIPYHLSLKKNFIPLDLMEKYGIAPRKFLSPDDLGPVKEILQELCQQAERHLQYLSNNKKHINTDVRSVYLLSALTREYLKTIKKADYNPFRLMEKAGSFSRQWHLLTSALFNRI